jgi:hypothetical protein
MHKLLPCLDRVEIVVAEGSNLSVVLPTVFEQLQKVCVRVMAVAVSV